jgi:cell wall-associated NlpC family hydrolase
VDSAQSTVRRRGKPAELARELNVSRQAIHELQNAGVIERAADGLIDFELARMAVAARVHPKGKTAQAVAAPQPQPAAAPAPAAPAQPAAQVTNFHVARTLREAAEARMAQLKLAELEGDLVRAADVAAAATGAATAIRQQLEQTPDRIAAEFGTDEAHRRALRRRIAEEIAAALRTTAAYLRTRPPN